MKGLPKEILGREGRVLVDRHNWGRNFENIFALCDLALTETSKYPDGHPQVAQTAIQRAALLAKNLKPLATGNPLKNFEYMELSRKFDLEIIERLTENYEFSLIKNFTDDRTYFVDSLWEKE